MVKRCLKDGLPHEPSMNLIWTQHVSTYHHLKTMFPKCTDCTSTSISQYAKHSGPRSHHWWFISCDDHYYRFLFAKIETPIDVMKVIFHKMMGSIIDDQYCSYIHYSFNHYCYLIVAIATIVIWNYHNYPVPSLTIYHGRLLLFGLRYHH